MRLGRNQLIALAGNAIVFTLGFALVWTGKLSGEAWLGAATLAVGHIIAQGARVNIAKARKEMPNVKAS